MRLISKGDKMNSYYVIQVRNSCAGKWHNAVRGYMTNPTDMKYTNYQDALDAFDKFSSRFGGGCRLVHVDKDLGETVMVYGFELSW